jgi:type II secretory pathway component PulF|tara:strand:+ start:337 stop:579 length:243 start_codon:yes stop_codon:yes gene_type:complete
LINEETRNATDICLIKLENLLNTILGNIILGQNFAEAIREKEEFSEYEYHSLKIGEETGTLQKVVEELGVFTSVKMSKEE